MRALILAAGWAARMGPLAADRPKHLLPVGSRCALDFCVDRLDALPELGGIDCWTHETFLPGFRAWAARRRTRSPLRVWSNGTRAPGERRGAVGDLAQYLGRARPEGPLLVLGGDQVFDFPLGALARAAASGPAVVVVDVGTRERVKRYASVALDATGKVTRLVEKDPSPPGSLAATAIYGLPADAFAEVRAHLAQGGSPDNLGHLAESWVRRGRLRGVLASGEWIDVGSADEYARARQRFGRGERSRGEEPPDPDGRPASGVC